MTAYRKPKWLVVSPLTRRVTSAQSPRFFTKPKTAEVLKFPKSFYIFLSPSPAPAGSQGCSQGGWGYASPPTSLFFYYMSLLNRCHHPRHQFSFLLYEPIKSLPSSPHEKFLATPLGVSCILFDGRIDITNVLVEADDTNISHPARIKEEHYSVVSEPGSDYLFHFTPPKATKEVSHARPIAKILYNWLQERVLTTLCLP